MPLAVFSDVHGNLEALRAVLLDMEAQGLTDMLSLGDIIGYGPDPEAICHIFRDIGIPSVLGNHELGLKKKNQRSWFNPVALKALDMTRAVLSPECLDFVTSFPASMVREGMRFVHGCPPDRTMTYLFEVDDEELKECMKQISEPLCFVGHTHELGLVRLRRGELEHLSLKPGVHELDSDARYIVNVGSVGQPRDLDKRAKYAVWNPLTRRLEIRAVEYDAAATVEKMRRLKLPESYATRLL